MAIVLKKDVDIIKELRNRGYTTYRLRKEKIIAEDMLTRIRKKQMVSIKALETLCILLSCQPGDIIEYIPTEEKI